MTSGWSYVVKHKSAAGVITDITTDVISIPLFTDSGSGDINTSMIILDAINGKYLTSTPVLAQFEKIRITGTDEDGLIYTNVFEIKKIIPSFTKDSGTTCVLECAGNEWYTQKINYAKPHLFESAFNVFKDIGDLYNTSRGTLQPTLEGHDSTTTNKLPTFTVNNFDYGASEANCYDRMIDVADKMGSSVDNGGVLDFFDVKIRSDQADLNDYDSMIIEVFSSGSTPTSNVVIVKDSTSVNVGDTEGGINASTGTNILSWGDNFGSLPISVSRFIGKQQAFQFHPFWVSGTSYPQNAKVQHTNGVHYRSNINNNTSTPPTNWTVITEESEFGDTIQYSPWTVDKSTVWKNSGSDLLSTGFGVGCWDSNLVIWDDTTFRTWADLKATNPATVTGSATLSKYLYGGTKFYRGFRILCNGVGAGAFAQNGGKDRFNKSYTNAVVEHNGSQNTGLNEYLNWDVKYVQQTDMSCAVIAEGNTYLFSGGTWTNISGGTAGNDAFHPYDSIGNTTGVINDPSFSVNQNSAIVYQYDFNVTSGLSPTSATYYKVGAWANWRLPFPHNKINAISELVGQLYGGSTSTNQEPATLDSQNMHLTHDGLRGFNQGDSSADFGPLQSLDFEVKLQFLTSLLGITYVNAQEANFKMRCYIYDTSDNVVMQDFVIPFNDNWTSITLPLSGFTVYRAKRPIDTTFGDIIPPKQIDVTNIFEWRNIKQIVIQTQESYSEEGQYKPVGSRYTNVVLGGGDASPFRRLKLYIDSFRFTKPLLVTTGRITDRNIEGEFLERPLMLNYDQLRNDALSELEKRKFQSREYDITTDGKFDIEFGDSFFYRNTDIVNDTYVAVTDDPILLRTPSDGITANTILLVAKKIEYSINKDNDGFVRRIIGSKRFY